MIGLCAPRKVIAAMYAFIVFLIIGDSAAALLHV
jgi:hypothetical protein